MNRELAKQAITIATLGNNRVVALTTHKPYLCFEAESEEALFAKVRKAIVFCQKVEAQLQQEIEREREETIKPITIKKTITIKELVDA